MSKEMWDRVKADVDSGWDALSPDQRYQFIELVEKGGDASPIGQLVADALKGTEAKEAAEVAEQTPTPAPVKRKRK